MNDEDVVDLTANEKRLYDLAWEPISYCYVTDTPTLMPTITPSSSPTTVSPSRMPTDEVRTICFNTPHGFLVYFATHNSLIQYSHHQNLHHVRQLSLPSSHRHNQQTFPLFHQQYKLRLVRQ